jgi:hypothetical protein
MKISLFHRAALSCVLAGWLLSAAHAIADDHTMKCNGEVPETHAQLAPGDRNAANHLELSRKVSTEASVDLDVCAAELSIVGGTGDTFRLTVDTADGSTPGSYLHTLDVSTHDVTVRLALPKRSGARVVVTLPAAISELRVNLVRGELHFETNKIGGDRSINVVSGNVELLANPDAYESLAVNVVMGHFMDHREDAHGRGVLVSKSLSGTGRGSIDINVVRGGVDLKAWD